MSILLCACRALVRAGNRESDGLFTAALPGVSLVVPALHTGLTDLGGAFAPATRRPAETSIADISPD